LKGQSKWPIEKKNLELSDAPPSRYIHNKLRWIANRYSCKGYIICPQVHLHFQKHLDEVVEA
jgi:hypothetical protein